MSVRFLAQKIIGEELFCLSELRNAVRREVA